TLPTASEPSTIVRMTFDDANPMPAITGAEQLPGIVNYFIGNDPAQWRTNISTYAGVVYKDLYPGIDLRYDGHERLLKSTYTVAPGADPSLIRWRYSGAERVSVDTASGDLQIALADGRVLTDQAPLSWQN